MSTRTASLSVLLVLALLGTGCKKDDESTNAGDTYTNKLTLGTGANYQTFSLTGETTTFTRVGGTISIFWRLESAADMGGSGISIKVEKNTSGTLSAFATYPYSNPQNYGHIVLSSFSMTAAGSYRATGILTANNTSVASVDFTVQ